MKRTHFPTKHPGLPYREKGEQALSFGVFQPPRSRPEDEATEKGTLEEEPAELHNVEVEAVHLSQATMEETEKEDVTNKELMEAIMKLRKLMEEKEKAQEKEKEVASPETDLKEKILLVQGSKTIHELCLKANLTAFESQSKLICDICHHEDLNDENARKQGEFNFDMFTHGDNFEYRSQPREYRNLKGAVIKHMESNTHLKMSKELFEKDKKDSENETYNWNGNGNGASQTSV